MFAYIKGTLEEKGNGYVIVEAGGIGYKIFMSNNSIGILGELKQIVKVHTYYYVREDNISLYGFTTKEELSMFELLLSVSGIGAKSAITMLSNIEPSEFALAVITNDIKKLTKIPGVGNKSAQRIVLELKDKLKADTELTKSEEVISQIEKDDILDEATAALQILGYTRRDIEDVYKKFDRSSMSTEEVIRSALKYLGK